MRGRRSHHRGFTLIELMIVVAIIGIAMALALPALAQAMRDRRLQQDAIDFMGAFREARSRAMLRGVAHLVTVQQTGAATLERVVEGNTSSCNLSNFTQLPSREVWRNTSLAASTETRVTSISPGVQYVEFCYSPSGRLFYRYDTASPFTDDNGAVGATPLNGGFLYALRNAAYPDLVQRRVFIPLGGVPRLAQ